MKPFACAKITGNASFPDLTGNAYFYPDSSGGIWIEVEINGLSGYNYSGRSSFFGMHIHEVGDCTLPFDKTGEHYNPAVQKHPNHAGDLPPLLSNDGYAFSLFYTNHVTADQIMNKSIVIHSQEDDFKSQPSGDAGIKIACGVIRECM